MVVKEKKILTIEEKMKEFEEKIRKQYELQEKLDVIHKRQGTGKYHNGSLNSNAVDIDLSKVKKAENSEVKVTEELEA